MTPMATSYLAYQFFDFRARTGSEADPNLRVDSCLNRPIKDGSTEATGPLLPAKTRSNSWFSQDFAEKLFFQLF